MKKILLFALAFISLCACSNENNPSAPIIETDYRLDSFEYYVDDVLLSKKLYYYSKSSMHYDSMYIYQFENGNCVPSTKETYIYDEKWNMIEKNISSYKNAQWRLNNTYYWSYNSNECKQTNITWSAQGAESYREEILEKTDSHGNPMSVIIKTYSHGSFHSYLEDKYDNYYTDNHLDSVYRYKRKDEQSAYEPITKEIYYYKDNRLDSLYRYQCKKRDGLSTFECTGKEIYSKYENNICTETITYSCKNNQFVPYTKRISRYDLYSNIVLSEYHSWDNNDWFFMWTMEYSYDYVPDRDLIENSSSVITDFDKEGNVIRVKRERLKYYYTKLN